MATGWPLITARVDAFLLYNEGLYYFWVCGLCTGELSELSERWGRCGAPQCPVTLRTRASLRRE